MMLSINNLNIANWIPLIYPHKTCDKANNRNSFLSTSFPDIYIIFDLWHLLTSLIPLNFSLDSLLAILTDRQKHTYYYRTKIMSTLFGFNLVKRFGQRYLKYIIFESFMSPYSHGWSSICTKVKYQPNLGDFVRRIFELCLWTTDGCLVICNISQMN